MIGDVPQRSVARSKSGRAQRVSDRRAQLLNARSDQDIADVLARMRADDASDAVMELPQVRRRRVLDLLPQPQNTKAMALLGYHHAAAGGLMGTDYLALSEDGSTRMGASWASSTSMTRSKSPFRGNEPDVRRVGQHREHGL